MTLQHETVPQAAVIVIARSEPAVVHNKQFNSKGCRFPGDFNQPVRSKIKIGCLPVIYQNRFAPARIRITEKVFPDCPVILTAHFSKSVRRADQRRLRGRERLSRLQCPTEMIGMNPHDQTAVFLLAALHSGRGTDQRQEKDGAEAAFEPHFCI